MDILIPYVDNTDPLWQEQYISAEKYPNSKLRDMVLRISNKRFASYGLFKYWWRALETNYKDFNTIHLLLMQESQYPNFLKKDEPRIRVHYHEEYVPSNYRPCFNSSTIELSAIYHLELPKHVLVLNDDIYFNRPIDDSSFLDNEHPIFRIKSTEPYGTTSFQTNLNNDKKLVEKHLGKTIPFYDYYHLAQVYDTEYGKSFLSKYWDKIESNMSSMRKPNNYNHLVLMMAQIAEGVCVDNPNFPYSGYYDMASLTKKSLESAKSKPIVCFNDTNGVVGLNLVREYLETKYPNKSSFEI